MRSPVLHEQYVSIEQQEHAYRLGMWLFLSSEVLLFATLFSIYAYYRVMYGQEFAEAIRHVDLTTGTINTFILATSTYTISLSLAAMRGGRKTLAALWSGGTAVLAAAFLALEGHEWATMIREGAVPGKHYHYAELPQWGAKLYFTIHFFLTGLHMLHVTAGLILLVTLTVRIMMGAYAKDRYLPLELGSLYWHFVDVMWFFIWACLYLARP